MTDYVSYEDNLLFIIKYENENDRQKTHEIFWINNKNKYNIYIISFNIKFFLFIFI